MKNLNLPKISCILTSYNRPEYLSHAIESVLDQTYKDFEIVLIDNDSDNPKVMKILEKYSKHPKVRLFKTGIKTLYERRRRCMHSVAINLGLAKSRGEYISYLCDDDVYLPKRFEKMIEKLESKPDISVVYCWWRAYNLLPSGQKTSMHVRKVLGKRGKCANPPLPLDRMVDVDSFMHKKTCLSKLEKPYWSEDPAVRDHNDGVFAEKLGEHYIFYPVSKVLFEHRFTSNSHNLNMPFWKLAGHVILSRLEWGKRYKVDIT